MSTTPNKPESSNDDLVESETATPNDQQPVEQVKSNTIPELKHQQVYSQPDISPEPVVDSTPLASQPVKKKWDFTHWLLGAVLVGGAAFFANHFNLIKVPTFSQKIAVIDTRLLIMAVSVEVNKEFKTGNLTLPQTELAIKQYINKMYKEAESYAANGYTVIPAQNVMFYSDKHDITEDIAKTLGVDYDEGIKALEEANMSRTAGNVFEQNASQLNTSSNPALSNPNVNFEDHSNLELQTKDGETSDLALFENQQ